MIKGYKVNMIIYQIIDIVQIEIIGILLDILVF